jgi:urease accessory protein
MNPAGSDGQVLDLLHVCDSLFPIGAFAHSDGLEAATASGSVRTGDDLSLWLDACLDESFGRLEGPAVMSAWTACHQGRRLTLRDLDAEVHALRPSATSRAASRAMGARLVKTWNAIHNRRGDTADRHNEGSVVEWDGDGPTLPVAFGMVSAASGIESRSALFGYAYTRLAATVSAAMRLMSIGQLEAHRLLANRLERAPLVVDAVIARGGAPSVFTPAMDLAAMSQQYVHSRLFRS